MTDNNYKTIVHPLEPCFTKESKILILGSFPSVKTREYGFFYGHPQNRFWRVMEIFLMKTLLMALPRAKIFYRGTKLRSTTPFTSAT